MTSSSSSWWSGLRLAIRSYEIEHAVPPRNATYLMPGPHGSETVQEGDILPQVREQPETGRGDKIGDAEEDHAEDGHGEEETQQAEEAPAQIVDALSHEQGPQRIEDQDEDGDEGQTGVDLAHDLAALVEPDVVHLLLGLLLGLDPDVPLPLDTFRLLGGVIVARVGIVLDDTERQHGHGQELEGVLQRGAVGDFGQGRILLPCLVVGGGLESSQRSFY